MAGRQNDDNVPDTRMSEVHMGERREVRYQIPIEIEVSGINHNGEVFHERMLTRDVSEWGCAFGMSVEVRVDQLISLRVISSGTRETPTHRPSTFQVVRVTQEDSGWLVGVWKIDKSDVWGVDFDKMAKTEEGSPASRKEETARRVKQPEKDADQ
jgi:hypothetical protein